MIRRTALSALLCLAAGAARGGEAPTVEDIMDRLSVQQGVVRRSLAERRGAEASGALASMGNLFGDLAGLHRRTHGGSAENWKKDCADARAFIDETQRAVSADRWDEAAAAFARVDDVGRRAHREFRHGFWTRLKLFFGGDKKASREASPPTLSAPAEMHH